MAARPPLTSRDTWSPGRQTRPRARNARTTRRLGAVACDICPAVLFRSGGPQISNGDLVERQHHPGRPTLVFASPESTYRAETTPTSAKKLGEALRRLRRRCVVPRRASPSRRNKTNDRTSSRRSRLFSGLALVIFPAVLTADVRRTLRGPNSCTKGHFGIVA